MTAMAFSRIFCCHWHYFADRSDDRSCTARRSVTKSDHLLKLFRKACSIEREALIIISGTTKIITVAAVKESFACFRVTMHVTR